MFTVLLRAAGSRRSIAVRKHIIKAREGERERGAHGDGMFIVV